MIQIEIPGFACLALEHLVLPFYGVMSLDAEPLPAVMERLAILTRMTRIHVLADIANSAAYLAAGRISARVECLPSMDQGLAKLDLVHRLGVDHTVVIGQGRSDALMLSAAALGVAVHCRNGLAREAASHADIIVRHTVDALGLLLWPDRLIESLAGPLRECMWSTAQQPLNEH